MFFCKDYNNVKFLTDMENILKICLVALVVCLAGKFVLWIVGYIQMCRLLMKLPQRPSHWLFGHALEIKNSSDFMNYVMDMVDKGAKVYCMWIGPLPVVGVTHPDTMKEIMKQEDRKSFGTLGAFSFMRNWLGDGLLLSSGKKWERNRHLVTPAFHSGILSRYVKTMNQTAETFCDSIAFKADRDNSVDVYPDACLAAFNAIIGCLLSQSGENPESKKQSYFQAVTKMSTFIWNRATNPLLSFDFIYQFSSQAREEKRILKTIHQFTGNIIEARRKEMKASGKPRAQPDFLDILLTARDEQGQGLSEQEIQDEVDTFAFAGHDSTASALSWAIYSLAKYPDLQRKVYDDVRETLGGRNYVTIEDINNFNYMPMFLKESMRYWTPVPCTSRQHTSNSVILDGYEIPVGPRVDINYIAVHKNPQVWPDPEHFDPSRFSREQGNDSDVNGFFPFSAGKRNCIGQVFSTNELKIAIAKLVQRFQILPDPEHTPQPLPDIVLRSHNGIRVIFKDRERK